MIHLILFLLHLKLFLLHLILFLLHLKLFLLHLKLFLLYLKLFLLHLKLFLLNFSFILICARSKICIAEAHVGFKAANRKSFPYIMHIVDEPQKFSPSNVLLYTVASVILFISALYMHTHYKTNRTNTNHKLPAAETLWLNFGLQKHKLGM